MTTKNRFQKVVTKRVHRPVFSRTAFFSPTNRDKSAVWALLGEVGYELPPFLSRDTERNRARQVFSLLIASTISLTAKEKPRTNALAEVHKLCMVVFDFLEYGVLPLRQHSR